MRKIYTKRYVKICIHFIYIFFTRFLSFSISQIVIALLTSTVNVIFSYGTLNNITHFELIKTRMF